MKKLFFIMVMILAGYFSQAQFSKATLQATGLTCAMCSNAINKALQKVSFVELVRSDIRNSAFNIVFRQGQPVNIDELKKAVEDAGFSVGSLKITGNFNNVQVSNDQHVKIGNDHFHFVHISAQTLNGEQTIQVVDKDFLTSKEFKKISSATKMSCIQTGKAASCCETAGVPLNTRIYHVTI
jgi:copper chaperone CopZ